MRTNNIELMPRQTSENRFHDSFLSAPSSVYRNCLKARDIMSKYISTVDTQSPVASAAMIIALVAYVSVPKWRRKRQSVNL